MWNLHQSHLIQKSQVFAVSVTGFSNLLHISQGGSGLAKLFTVVYLEGLREPQCIFHCSTVAG